jgi:hypothetical protein
MSTPRFGAGDTKARCVVANGQLDGQLAGLNNVDFAQVADIVTDKQEADKKGVKNPPKVRLLLPSPRTANLPPRLDCAVAATQKGRVLTHPPTTGPVHGPEG